MYESRVLCDTVMSEWSVVREQLLPIFSCNSGGNETKQFVVFEFWQLVSMDVDLGPLAHDDYI